MDYFVGDRLCIGGVIYNIVGKIRYKNLQDDENWTEYRLLDPSRHEKWLSVDSVFREYSISWVSPRADRSAYHLVDSGVECAIGCWGSVDVDQGEKASFEEYEDITEEKIISVEYWEDEVEVCEGYYIEESDIQLVSQVPNRTDGPSKGDASSQIGKVIGVVFAFYAICIMVPMIIAGIAAVFSLSTPKIARYLEKNTFFTYVTSITGEDKQKADVYKSSLDLDTTARKIIDELEGNTEDVQQNTEDGDESIAILTRNEYCLVYLSEQEDEVLVQVSNRKYAYTTDKEMYHAHRTTSRYYRRYYYSKGYTKDYSKYKKTSSSYDAYSDTSVGSSAGDTYNSYSNSVRQASQAARASSGGGTSSGK